MKMENIYQSKPGSIYKVIEQPDTNLLKTLGIYVGAKVLKKRSYNFGGPVLIVVDGRDIAIGKKIAKNIIVSKGEE